MTENIAFLAHRRPETCSHEHEVVTMNEPKNVAVLVGSLRAASLSRKIAKTLIAKAPPSLACKIVEIGELPLYNEDLEASVPAAWKTFREAIKNVDAIVFVTPEYNRSVPGCLKNALDVGSRPDDQSVFTGLPAGVVSVTPYNLGAFGANHALRQTFVFLDMPVMQQPEMYIGKAGEEDPKRDELLAKFMSAFATWTTKIRNDKHDFPAFLEKRKKIASDYVNGKTSSLEAIATSKDPATFFSPKGDTQRGATDIAARFVSDAKAFKEGGTTQLEILQSGASGDLAFWTGLQHADARMGESGDKVSMTLRVTEVFRVEGGEYKLVHRHADPAGERKR